MKVVILGCGQMLMSLIAGCMDAGCDIVGVFRYEKVRLPFVDRIIEDLFNPSKEYTYIKSHKLYEINARSANSAEFKKEVMRLNADLVIVGTWGEKIKKSIIDLPKIATINAHPALLPRYRGPNPYLQTIKHLEKESGVTFHLMDENFDTGPILHQKIIPILPQDTGKELRERTYPAAREGVFELLKELDNEIIVPVAQDEKVASYFSQISEDEVMLDFFKPAEEVAAHIRAFHPWFKCYFPYNNHFFIPNPYKLQIFEDLPSPLVGEGIFPREERVREKLGEGYINYNPGTIIEKSHKDKSVTVVCGDGKLLKMEGIKLYGFLGFLTALYIKFRVHIQHETAA